RDSTHLQDFRSRVLETEGMVRIHKQVLQNPEGAIPPSSAEDLGADLVQVLVDGMLRPVDPLPPWLEIADDFFINPPAVICSECSRRKFDGGLSWYDRGELKSILLDAASTCW